MGRFIEERVAPSAMWWGAMWLGAMGLGAASIGCASSTARTACMRGEEVSCACPNGQARTQTCRDDGTFDPCTCSDAGAAPALCIEGQTSSCACRGPAPGVATCEGGAWGACACPAAVGDACTPAGETVVGTAARQSEDVDVVLPGVTGLRAIWPVEDALLFDLTLPSGLGRLERGDRALRTIGGPVSVGAALRGETLHVATALALGTYDTHLRRLTTTPLERQMTECALLGCPLWSCVATEGDSVTMSLDGTVLSANQMFHPRPLLDRAAYFDTDHVSDFDALGIATRTVATQSLWWWSPPAQVLGVAPHRVLATGAAALDLEPCFVGDGTGCLAPRFSFGADSDSHLYDSVGSVAVALSRSELVVVDLATGLGQPRSTASITGDLGVDGVLLAVAYDAWAQQVVVAFRRCASCEATLRFVNVEAP